ncbi:MAG: glycine cleavage system aminomethyltransferase GcvT [Candidatus Lokiarchaeota archaeon]|nr:glycine cleavage system aminomethyltransferase GcvT [Candidatus Lokiarchaeota archaeon]MBD3339601.1 glycine cleavage system aminomethyltransferase GcvT [Candidatus Lokiarchaeota archaeon]
MSKNSDLKETPLCKTHVELGAQMTEFAGWKMPLKYESIISEHKYVRNEAGLFDISHMGEFEIIGSGAFDLLQYLMTNDLQALKPGKSQYSCICYENGTVVDDAIYYMESQEKFRIIVNASNTQKDFDWIQSHAKGFDVRLKDVTLKRSRIAFQGPKSEEYLTLFSETDLSEIGRFFFKHINLKNYPVIIARTGYTGEMGFELSFNNDYTLEIWKMLIDTRARPIGLGARDTLRLEACYSLYGHEISDQITPIEAGMPWVVKPKENVDFIGKKALLRQKKEGTERIIVGLTLKEPGIIRANYKIFKSNHQIGYVTSGGYSPTLDKTIGLGLVETVHSQIGTPLKIKIRNKLKEAEVVSTPFYRNI